MSQPRGLSPTTVLLLILALALGGMIGASGKTYTLLTKNSPLPDVIRSVVGNSSASSTFDEVWNEVHKKYVNGNLNDDALVQGAIAGMVNAVGDPYTVYFNPSEAKSFSDDINGVFDGVGMEIGPKDKNVVVIAPLPDSPAEKAGMKAGDIIIAVDTKSVAGLSVDEVVQKIRGKRGTTVSIQYQRGSAQPQTVSITRDQIVLKAVASTIVNQQGKKYAHIIIASFTQTVGQEFRTIAQQNLDQKVDGFIIDLRGNPGGYLDQAVDIASSMIPSGTIVSEEGRDGAKKTYSATGGPILGGQKIVVLVNGGSASASEILAGALQDTKRATIIGEQTFGKGVVQELDPISGGASLKVTVAKWYTPSGRSIQEHGITPDQVVTLTAANVTANKDTQLDAAVATLLKP